MKDKITFLTKEQNLYFSEKLKLDVLIFGIVFQLWSKTIGREKMAVATKYEEWMEPGEITEETPIEWYEEEHARAILVSEIDRQTADLSEEEAFDIFTKLMEGDPWEVLRNLRTEGKLSKEGLEELEEYEEDYRETHEE